MDFPAQDVPEGARFGVRILGDSMEPAIHDGQIAWVDDRVELSDGEIGIFRLESGAVCKRLRLGANGRAMRLESINPAYAPITGKALAGLEGVGRVIGTAWPPGRAIEFFRSTGKAHNRFEKCERKFQTMGALGWRKKRLHSSAQNDIMKP